MAPVHIVKPLLRRIDPDNSRVAGRAAGRDGHVTGGADLEAAVGDFHEIAADRNMACVRRASCVVCREQPRGRVADIGLGIGSKRPRLPACDERRAALAPSAALRSATYDRLDGIGSNPAARRSRRCEIEARLRLRTSPIHRPRSRSAFRTTHLSRASIRQILRLPHVRQDKVGSSERRRRPAPRIATHYRHPMRGRPPPSARQGRPAQCAHQTFVAFRRLWHAAIRHRQGGSRTSITPTLAAGSAERGVRIAVT